jgi:tRNA nucleotidyltransferase (CCA-adding enzyme)
MEIYLVGGAVRNQLLGIEVREHDWVVTGATPEMMQERGFRQVGKEFPVFLHPETGEEYALARTERKTGPGYRGFSTEFSPDVTLEEDLRRRDLTVNAIARDRNGELIDPFGGQADIRARLLRHVSPAFAEDPVRILRAARFASQLAQHGFTIAPETMTLMHEMVVKGEADHLVPERVWSETSRALAQESPHVFFQVLRECGALAVVFPEIDALFGVPQPPRWHPEIDTGVHTIMVLEQAAALSAKPRVRFAALVHDLGKAQTPKEEWPSHRGHEHGSVRLILNMCKRLRIPNDFRKLAVKVAEFHGHAHRAPELRPGTLMKVLESTDAFRNPGMFEEFLLACEADARGRTGLEQRPYPQAELLRRSRDAAAAVTVSDLDVEGLDGPAVGARLKQARIAAIAKVCG